MGGALYVFEGAQPGVILRALASFGLQEPQVVGCGANDVVVFVQGVDAEAAARLEAGIVAETKARTKEKVVVSPQKAPPPPRPSRD